MGQISVSRRSFLITSTTIAFTSMAGVMTTARAADPRPLDPNSPRAVTLGYVTNHQRVDVKRWPKKGAAGSTDSRCVNCALYTGDDSQGTCRIFQGQIVTGNGWCNAWTKG